MIAAIPALVLFTGLLCCVVGFVAARADRPPPTDRRDLRRLYAQDFAWPRKRFW
jgi:hypothetical protein